MSNPYQPPREESEPAQEPKAEHPLRFIVLEVLLVAAIVYVLWKMLVPEVS